jgi:hypothetical protein
MPIVKKQVNGLEVVEVLNSFSNSLPDQDMYLMTDPGLGNISISVGAASTYALDHRFILDNTRGNGTVNVNSSTFTVDAGTVKQVTVVPDGAGKKFDVRDPKWLGLSTESDVQNALTNARKAGRTVELAGGEIPVTTTLTTPFSIGGGMRGKGVAEPLAYTHSLQGLASRLVWAGGSRGSGTENTNAWTGSVTPTVRPLDTLVHYTGSDMSLEQFCLDGATRSQIDESIAKCSLGLLINRTANGIGTGKIHARKLTFNYFDTAIQVGTHLSEHSCDESAWYDVMIDRCGTGMLTKNLQGMGHTFYNLRFWRTNIGFDFQAGGDLTCYRTFLSDEITLLKLRNQASSFGLNNGKYHFYGVKTDAQGEYGKLVDMEAGSNYYSIDILFDGLHVGTNTLTNYDHMFHIADRTILQVRDSKNLRKGMFRWTTSTAAKANNQTFIIVENCRLMSNVTAALDLFDSANSTGSCHVIVRNCIVDGSKNVLNADFEYGT